MAALYYNENAGRAQAFTKEGIARYKMYYGRGHEGTAALAVTTDPTLGYVSAFFNELDAMIAGGHNVAPVEDDPPTVASKKSRPTKDEAIAVRETYKRYSDPSKPTSLT